MNYTTNYHLPQWDETDRIMRTDFNRMCKDVESGLTGNASAAAAAKARGDKGVSDAAAAHTAARNAQTSANTAQSTADKAVQDAAKAQAKADAAYAPDQPPYVIGTYVGNGREVSVTVGFKPRFLVIGGGLDATFQFAVAPETNAGTHITFTDTGFAVRAYRSNPEDVNSKVPPHLSHNQTTYTYIAFQ